MSSLYQESKLTSPKLWIRIVPNNTGKIGLPEVSSGIGGTSFFSVEDFLRLFFVLI